MMSKTVIIEQDKYKVDIDKYNHTLYKYDLGGYEVRLPRTGEVKPKDPSWDLVGYFPNMRQCMTKAVELELIEGNTPTNIEGYLKELKAIIKDLGGKFTV